MLDQRLILKKNVAVWASMWLVFIVVFIASSVFGQTGIVMGAKYNDGPVQSFIGGIQTYNQHVSFFASAEITQGEQSYALQPVITFQLFDQLYLCGLVGPQIERVEMIPTQSQMITYLMASTGFMLAYKFTDKFVAFAGYDYQITDKITDNYSVGVGIVSYF